MIVTLENSVAASGRPAEKSPPTAIANIAIATIDPTTAFALSQPSNSGAFLG